jgi:hypothetical protein
MKATTISIQAAEVLRFFFTAAMALAVALLLTQGVGAQPNNKPVSQADRIQAQRDMCETIGGGTLEVTDSPFKGIKLTECKGGTEDGTKCAHGRTKTNCTYPKQAGHGQGQDIVVDQGEIVGADENGGSVSPVEDVVFDHSGGGYVDVGSGENGGMILLPLEADQAP